MRGNILERKSAFDHPYDSPFTSILRFLAELIAWIACPWADGLMQLLCNTIMAKSGKEFYQYP
jgi:hypothetical protein